MDKILKAKQLYDENFSLRKIAKLLNVHHSTISDWKKRNWQISNKKITPSDFPKTYSYLLGLYLGDGYINSTPRTYRLRYSLDKKYNKLNEYVIQQLKILFPFNKVSTYVDNNTVVVSLYNNQLVTLFPQHGTGKKHNRLIKLEEWQNNILDHSSFIKGLFHSDGSYYQSGIYDRYNFTNMSKDIIQLYKESCTFLNISYCEVNYHNGKNVITHNKRKDVLFLKETIGIKE
jgi:hypothetical protein